ncbi:MAG: protein-glutamine glutaminase family protein, partial [Pseudomonadota bacterium]
MKKIIFLMLTTFIFNLALAEETKSIPPSKDFADGSNDDIRFYMKDHTYYQGTVVPSVSKAQEVFDELNGSDRGKSWWRFRKGAQCFQRAHFWNYQMYQEQNWKSYKIFLFYSKHYRRTHRGEHWWFHVAPLILV